jgi:hypothetical protein
MAEAIRIGDITVHRIVEQETPGLPKILISPCISRHFFLTWRIGLILKGHETE